MKVYELTLKVYLLKNIPKENALEKIAELIDKTLTSTEKYQKFHDENAYKYYTFNSLYKLEDDGIYKEGNIYTVKIRTVNEELSQYLHKNIVNTYTNYLKGLTVEKRVLKRGHINKIYSINPIIIKTDQGYWRKYLSIEDYLNRIAGNIIKKYNFYYDTKIDEDFELFQRIEFTNKKPISCSYKSIHLLGDKLDLYIAENQMAQDLAYFALAAGVGEMSSRGYGFSGYKFL